MQKDGLENVAKQSNSGSFQQDSALLNGGTIFHDELLDDSVQFNGEVAFDIHITSKVLHTRQASRESENGVHFEAK